jgi:hypothetical protein
MPTSRIRSVALLLFCAVSASAPAAVSNALVSGPEAVPSPSPVEATATNSAPAPSGNRYDILSRMITPLAGVLLGGKQSTDRALTLRATVGQIAGRLPGSIRGSSFTVRVQYPGRIRVDAPVLGSTFTVCRDGNAVWAVPGEKIRYLLGQFRHKPLPHPKNGAPLALPITPEQAVLLPALFQLDDSEGVAELSGSSCRVISGGLMPELAKASGAEDFSAKLWICPEYTPKRVDIRRSDFAMSFLIEELTYAPSLPAATWAPPQGTKDVYRCSSAELEQLLYVVMNSLQMKENEQPWLDESAPSSPLAAPSAPSLGLPR